jgi:methionine-rich copper-binding protein CopC
MRIPIRAISRLAALAFTVLAVGAGHSPAGAHAELESSNPGAGATIQTLPSTITLVFAEEVRPGSESVDVTGPDGARVDTGDGGVDLTDPLRRTVTVSLFAGAAGTYAVHWENVSNIDGDPSQGDFTFTVDPNAAATPSPEPTVDPDARGNPLSQDDDFDGRAFAISVGAGIVALGAIVAFWFAVRPRNPRFGSRTGRNEG